MAFSKNSDFEAIHDGETKKIVIIAGANFGSAMGFMLLGAAIGAAATVALRRRASESTRDAEQPDLFPEPKENPSRRLKNLTKRLGVLATRARDAVGTISESLAPVVQDAIQEARATAEEAQKEMERELHEETETARS